MTGEVNSVALTVGLSHNCEAFTGAGLNVLCGALYHIVKGVGHCAVVSTKEGDKMLFHAYDRETGYNAGLLVRPVDWDRNGWPSIRL